MPRPTTTRRAAAARFLNHPKLMSWLLILLAALIASAPRIMRGISCGHDFDFHLISWMEVERSWHQHILYPHWAESPNWGTGEPRFVFYPPMSWMFGGLLGYLMNWYWVPAAYTFLCFAGAGITTRALARRFLSESKATLAGILAAATPYGLFVAYERTAFSELAAAVWIPLLLLLTLRGAPLSSSSRSRMFALLRSSFLLTLVIAVIWLTNAPAGVMASYLVAFTSLASAVLRRSWIPIVRAGIVMPIALGLAAIYLVPAAWEQRWIAINHALDVGMRVRDSWLFARHNDPDLALHDQVLLYASILFTLTTLMAAAGLAISLRRRILSRETRPYWIPLALLIPILLLLQLPLSSAIWHLPKLEFLQFPWRWLMVLATPYAIFLAAATPLRTRRSRILSAIFWMAVLIAFTVSASRQFFQFCDEEDQVSNQISIFQNGSGMLGTDEYAPTGADNSLVADGLPDGCLVTDPTQQLGEGDANNSPDWYPEQGSCDDTYTAKLWQPEHKLLELDSDHSGYLVLRLRRYPAWRVTVNGTPLTNEDTVLNGYHIPLRDDGLMLIPVGEGVSKIDMRWATTPDELWGRSISIVSLVLLILLGIGFWRPALLGKSSRLSS